MESKKCKYVDDLTLAKSIDLEKNLKKSIESDLERPLNFHERTEHILPVVNNVIQKEVKELETYCNKYKMKINNKKTKVMLFNSKIKTDFQPKIFLQDGSLLEVVEEVKLLGVIITSDLKWKKNTKNIIIKAYKRMWMVKRLKSMGVKTDKLKLAYVQQVRSVLEIAAPAWNSGLTISEKLDIERVQKSFLPYCLW